jgi:hypothetical protein
MRIIFEIDAIPGEIDLIDGLLDDMVEGVCDALRKWRNHVSFETSEVVGNVGTYRVKVLGVGAKVLDE